MGLGGSLKWVTDLRDRLHCVRELYLDFSSPRSPVWLEKNLWPDLAAELRKIAEGILARLGVVRLRSTDLEEMLAVVVRRRQELRKHR
jgi:hypothetical protein